MLGVFAAACRYALFKLVRLKLVASASDASAFVSHVSSPLLYLALLDMLCIDSDLLLLVLLQVRLSVAVLPVMLAALLLLLLLGCVGHPRSVSTR
jgi:hypothetical protein